MNDLDEKLHNQQAANRKLQRKYEVIKGDLRVKQRNNDALRAFIASKGLTQEFMLSKYAEDSDVGTS